MPHVTKATPRRFFLVTYTDPEETRYSREAILAALDSPLSILRAAKAHFGLTGARGVTKRAANGTWMEWQGRGTGRIWIDLTD